MPKAVPLRQQAIVRDGLIRAGELSKLLGVTVPWLRILSGEGHIPMAEDGFYPLALTLRRFIRYYRKMARSKAQTYDKAEVALLEARTRLINLRCDERESRHPRIDR